MTTEQQLGQGVEEEGLAGAWAAAPQLGFKGGLGGRLCFGPGKAPSSQATGWEAGQGCELRPEGPL